MLFLTTDDDADTVLEALRLGADGYLVKGAGQEEILRAVHAVHDGQMHPGGRRRTPHGAQNGCARRRRPRVRTRSRGERQALSGTHHSSGATLLEQHRYASADSLEHYALLGS